MDHPVVALGVEQGVAATDALAVEDGDHLIVAELLRLVAAAVPDHHGARPVLALGDLTLELQVLERVVLGPHRQPVLVRVGGDPTRHGPGSERALVLEPEVPVQAPGIVLLHHEARIAGALALFTALRLGCPAEVPLRAIAA